MSFLLKIVEGPNKGASVALVAGVAVKVGKGDDCDIILADPTLPDAPLVLEADDAGVTVDGDAIEPLHVKTVGATSFAVGPADSAWGELVWPAPEEPPVREQATEEPAAPKAPSPEKPEETVRERRRGLGVGCLVALLMVVLAIAALWRYFGDRIVRLVEKSTDTVVEVAPPRSTLADVASRYSLSVERKDGREVLFGNLKTRAQRLAATAEAYEAKPGVEVDLSDDESFRASAVDALFTLTEGAVKVVSATNRVVALSGLSRSPAALERMLRALGADLPKMRDVDVSRIAFSEAAKDVVKPAAQQGATSLARSSSAASKGGAKKSARALTFPVCGILMTPYPCLVMRNGSRVLEGASVGGGVILKIEADKVTVSNSTGVVVWKP